MLIKVQHHMSSEKLSVSNCMIVVRLTALLLFVNTTLCLGNDGAFPYNKNHNFIKYGSKVYVIIKQKSILEIQKHSSTFTEFHSIILQYEI